MATQKAPAKKAAKKPVKAKAKKPVKAKAKTKVRLLVRWKGLKGEENVAFCDGWGTIHLNGWSAGIHVDKTTVLYQNEIDDMIDNFLSIMPDGKHHFEQWEFAVLTIWDQYAASGTKLVWIESHHIAQWRSENEFGDGRGSFHGDGAGDGDSSAADSFGDGTNGYSWVYGDMTGDGEGDGQLGYGDGQGGHIEPFFIFGDMLVPTADLRLEPEAWAALAAALPPTAVLTLVYRCFLWRDGVDVIVVDKSARVRHIRFFAKGEQVRTPIWIVLDEYIAENPDHRCAADCQRPNDGISPRVGYGASGFTVDTVLRGGAAGNMTTTRLSLISYWEFPPSAELLATLARAFDFIEHGLGTNLVTIQRWGRFWHVSAGWLVIVDVYGRITLLQGRYRWRVDQGLFPSAEVFEWLTTTASPAGDEPSASR